MLCVEDYIDALEWSQKVGGLEGLVGRADANTKAIADWVAKTLVGRFPRQERGHPLQHQRVPEGCRSRHHRAARKTSRRRS
jgi:hypothetical protein